jgi:tRNA G26 N,N-dimethylase Trm1
MYRWNKGTTPPTKRYLNLQSYGNNNNNNNNNNIRFHWYLKQQQQQQQQPPGFAIPKNTILYSSVSSGCRALTTIDTVNAIERTGREGVLAVLLPCIQHQRYNKTSIITSQRRTNYRYCTVSNPSLLIGISSSSCNSLRPYSGSGSVSSSSYRPQPYDDTINDINNNSSMPRKGKQSSDNATSNSKNPTVGKNKPFSRQYTDTTSGMIIIEEGSCSMCIEPTHMNDVFYNPVQVQNRDLSILMLNLYGERRQQLLRDKMQKHQLKQQQHHHQQHVVTDAVSMPSASTQNVDDDNNNNDDDTTDLPKETADQKVDEMESVVIDNVQAPAQQTHETATSTTNDVVIASATATTTNRSLTTAERLKLKKEAAASAEAAVVAPLAVEHDVSTTSSAIPTTDTSTTTTTAATTYNHTDPILDVPKVELQILDALAASGLRSMRYWKECSEYVSHITINDIDPVAADRAKRNVERNELSHVLIPTDQPLGRPYGIRIQTTDATNVMYNSRAKRQKRPHLMPNMPTHRDPLLEPLPDITPQQESQMHWDVIDIDPYGSASTFIDAAVQSITHGGPLNITCTDMRSLCIIQKRHSHGTGRYRSHIVNTFMIMPSG